MYLLGEGEGVLLRTRELEGFLSRGRGPPREGEGAETPLSGIRKAGGTHPTEMISSLSCDNIDFSGESVQGSLCHGQLPPPPPHYSAAATCLV